MVILLRGLSPDRKILCDAEASCTGGFSFTYCLGKTNIYYSRLKNSVKRPLYLPGVYCNFRLHYVKYLFTPSPGYREYAEKPQVSRR